ncbi:MAG: DUF29 family protein [Alphaproteobacteria bacterium]|jgi:hypothetical protein|nr:DUF29 family protein [Alphaproteobacteria bacterium]
MSVDLYDRDFLLWTEEQAAALRRAGETRVNAPVDWQAVAEEIEDLGKSEQSAVESFLRLLILHCLKLEYARAEEPRNHWRKEIDNFRAEIRIRVGKSPSLKSKIDLGGAYESARSQARFHFPELGLDPACLPEQCPYALAELLDIDWWPENRHGLT